jgi:REP element-mobilizing transposase RayT
MDGISKFTATRRSLPHFQEPGRTYFITWRTADGAMLEPDDRAIALRTILHWDEKRWAVYAAVVMPDHVHVLARPLPVSMGDPSAVHDLTVLLHSVKSFSAHEISRRRGRRGAVWQDERYDRAVRDRQELMEMWRYIEDNPVKAGLAPKSEAYERLHRRQRAE